MVEVTKKSGYYEFILQLENGFDTVVGGAVDICREERTAYLDCPGDAKGCTDRHFR